MIDKNLDDRNIAMALKERKKTDALQRLAMFSSISHDDARRSFVFISTIVLRVVVEYVLEKVFHFMDLFSVPFFTLSCLI